MLTFSFRTASQSRIPIVQWSRLQKISTINEISTFSIWIAFIIFWIKVLLLVRRYACAAVDSFPYECLFLPLFLTERIFRSSSILCGIIILVACCPLKWKNHVCITLHILHVLIATPMTYKCRGVSRGLLNWCFRLLFNLIFRLLCLRTDNFVLWMKRSFINRVRGNRYRPRNIDWNSILVSPNRYLLSSCCRTANERILIYRLHS